MLSYEQDGDLLLVRFPDYETAEEVRPYIDAALELSGQLGLTRVLVDTTANPTTLAPLDYRRVGQYLARRPRVERLKIAVLRRPELVEDARLLEELLSDRGMTYRVFADRAAARQWLQEGGAGGG